VEKGPGRGLGRWSCRKSNRARWYFRQLVHRLPACRPHPHAQPGLVRGAPGAEPAFRGAHVEHVDCRLPDNGLHGIVLLQRSGISERRRSRHRFIEAAVEVAHARSCSFRDGGIGVSGAMVWSCARAPADIAVEGNHIRHAMQVTAGWRRAIRLLRPPRRQEPHPHQPGSTTPAPTTPAPASISPAPVPAWHSTTNVIYRNPSMNIILNRQEDLARKYLDGQSPPGAATRCRRRSSSRRMEAYAGA